MNELVNPATREWRIVAQWAEDRLKQYRSGLENVTVDDRTTTYMRGRIAELKALLELGKPPDVRPPIAFSETGDPAPAEIDY